MTWSSIPGFSADIELYYAELAKSLPQGARVVEVGVLFGRSVSYLSSLRPDLDIWAVDTWEPGDREGDMAEYQAHYGNTWAAFLGGMRDHAPDVLDRIHVVRARSTDVTLPLADVVFIDADHSYEAVLADIHHWRRGVKVGGIIAGHDYLEPNHPGVVQAVTEVFWGAHKMGPGEWTSVWTIESGAAIPARAKWCGYCNPDGPHVPGAVACPACGR